MTRTGPDGVAPVVSAYFGCRIPPDRITFGPGVTSLLAALAGLAEGGLIVAPPLTHLDLEAWAIARGARTHLYPGPLTPPRLAAEVKALRPTVVHLDQPTFAGELLTPADLEAVGRAAAQVGAVVLVDESPASYLGPAGSAVPLTRRLGNLVILRGMTKALSLGGLRVGFAVAGGAVAPRVRELVSPLQVAELSFRAALRVLAAGDIFGPLRTRIRETKPALVAALERLGFAVLPGHPELPWVLIPDDSGAASVRLTRLGVRALRLSTRPAPDSRMPEYVQLFVPLSDERITTFHRLMGTGPGHRLDPLRE
jgi:histidinol-phosphate/aromatic aminotransferase/cobyric acid decarboxylase-like protein